MDKLTGLISNIELAIRYLLSGVAIYAIYLMSISDVSSHIEWINHQPVLAGVIAVSVGFVAYSLYRVIFWVVGDGVAWHLRISAPALNRGDLRNYPSAYASFLLWRRGTDFSESLDGYLHYRWAVVHFTFIVVIALCFALVNKQPGSLIETWQCCAAVASVTLFVVAIWQSSFLFRVERELYSRTRGSGA